MSGKSPRAHVGRITRRVLIAVAVILLLLGMTAFMAPYLLKRYIENHSVEWIGRELTIRSITLNPFTFTYAVDGVTCREPGSDEVFVSWESISVKSNLWEGFRKQHWRFSKVRIQEPYVHVVQNGTRFNFSDLMELGGDGPADAQQTDPVVFSMEDIQITDGRITYASDLLKAPVSISAFQANCTRITSENGRMDFGLGFVLDQGGRLDGGFRIDTDRNRYAIRANLEAFKLASLLPYMQDFMHAGSLKGVLDLKLDLEDSWADTTSLAVSGDLRLKGLELSDEAGGPLFAIGEGRAVLDTLNAQDQAFHISRVSVDGFSTRFQQWPDGSHTWTRVLKLDSTSTDDGGTVLAADPANVFVLLADYIRLLGKEFVANEYSADSILLTNANVDYEDFVPERPFRYKLDQVDIRSGRVATTEGTADFIASARLNQRGQLNSIFRFDPKDIRNVTMDLHVKDLVLTDLDPYGRWYAAHPIRSGTLDYNGSTSILDSRIDSKNHLEVDNLRFDKKVATHAPDIYVLPLRLGASLLRDVNGKIDLDIPVTGDLNDPEFKPWPIVWRVLRNLVTKAAAAPVKLVGGMFGAKEDGDVEELHFPWLAAGMGKEQTKPLDALVLLLKEKPELGAALVSVTDQEEEASEWAAKQAKMQFLGVQAPLAKDDSLRVINLSLRDSAFVGFLDGQVPETKGRHERERCMAVVGPEQARDAVRGLEKAREQAVAEYLEKAGAPRERIAFRDGSSGELTGYRGNPGFRFIVDVRDVNGPE